MGSSIKTYYDSFGTICSNLIGSFNAAEKSDKQPESESCWVGVPFFLQRNVQYDVRRT